MEATHGDDDDEIKSLTVPRIQDNDVAAPDNYSRYTRICVNWCLAESKGKGDQRRPVGLKALELCVFFLFFSCKP